MCTFSQYLSVYNRKILIILRGELFSKFGTLLVKICLKQSHQGFQDGEGVRQGEGGVCYTKWSENVKYVYEDKERNKRRLFRP